MSGIEIGTVCIKTKGREAGAKVVIVDFDAKAQFVIIDGPQIKRRRCNLRHLFPTNEKLKITKNSEKKSIVELLKK